MMKKVFKWIGRSILAIMLTCGVYYVVASLIAPPQHVTPGNDLLATGTPSLPFPPGMGETYEPHISIDPKDPNHISVAAMTGNRFGHAGKNIHRWISRDGGKSWSGEIMPAVAGQGIFAADVVIGFDEAGRDHLVTMFGNSSMIDDPALFYVLFSLKRLTDFIAGRPGTEEEENSGGIALAVGDPLTGKVNKPIQLSSPNANTDKTWLTVDNSATSPFRGTVYAAWSDFGPPANVLAPDAPARILMATWRDGSVSKERVIVGPESYGVALATRPDGRLDLVHSQLQGRSIVHLVSVDGGDTFGKPVDVRAAETDVRVDLPAVTVAPDGTVLACWNESTVSVPVRVKCATTSGSEHWSAPIDLDRNISSRGVIALPAVAANAQGLWVLAYKSDQQTEVVLYRSIDGGRSFHPYSVLATRAFGADKMCAGAGHDMLCRYNPLQSRFQAGDYVGLSAVDGRVAAAFALTLGDDPVQFVTTYVKVLDVPAMEH